MNMSAMQRTRGETRSPIDATSHSPAAALIERRPRWPTQIVAERAPDSPVEPNDPSGSSGSDGSASASDRGANPNSLIRTRVGGYLITKRLGAGGAGEVFKGVDVMLKRTVAIKVLRTDVAGDPAALERFRHEAQILARLSHLNIASVHTFLEEGDMQCMVMEYVSGMSLDELIRTGGPVPAERALRIFRPVLDGIGYAHRCGVVHRDIKPANVMLADDGAVKVMDFGIARVVDANTQLTCIGQIPGTARYMSPEQVRGEEADARSDIYSLGILLYMLLCGRAPFTGSSDYNLMRSHVEQAPPPLSGLIQDVPADLEAAVMRALAKAPGERFQTAEEFASTLDACLANLCSARQAVEHLADASDLADTVLNVTLVAAPSTKSKPDSSAAFGPAQPLRALDCRQVVEPVPADVETIWATRSDVRADWLHGLDPNTSNAFDERRDLRPLTTPTSRRRVNRRALVLMVLAPLVTGAVLGVAMHKKAPVVASAQPVATDSTGDIAPAQSQPVRDIPALQPDLAAAATPGPSVTAAAEQTAQPQLEAKSMQPDLAIIRMSFGDPKSVDAASNAAAAGIDASSTFAPGELIHLLVKPKQDAHVYCYLQDETRRIVRFFPNRFSGGSALVTAAAPLQLPGTMRFELVANAKRVTETVACFATERNVMAELPAVVTGTDFQPLPVTSLDQVKHAFIRVAGDQVGQARFLVEFK